MVASINSRQSSWKASTYPQFDDLSSNDFVNMAGGHKSGILRYVFFRLYLHCQSVCWCLCEKLSLFESEYHGKKYVGHGVSSSELIL